MAVMRFLARRRNAFKSKMTACVVLSVLLAACGNGSKSNVSSSANAVSGNWQISLQPSDPKWKPTSQSGFLLDTNGVLTGGMMLTDLDCSGVGNVSGNVDGSNVSFNVTPTGIDMAFTGSMSQPNTMSGSYTILSSGCSGFYSAPQTGTWIANLVTPLSGTIQGTFVSNSGVTYPFTGQVTQGANTGLSNANLSGTLDVTGYCFFTATANITGIISGTSVVMNFADSNGTQIGQVIGTSALDGKSVTGTYKMIGFGKGVGAQPPCINGEKGTVTFTF